jgi:hypothetical protein
MVSASVVFDSRFRPPHGAVAKETESSKMLKKRPLARHGLRRAAAGLALAVALPVATASTALAAVPTTNAARPLSSPCSATSCVYNYSAGYVAVTCVTGSGCATNATLVLNNGSQVFMECWFTGPSATGNYSSNRWFHVIVVPYAGEWIVHSSYVYNQTGVGSC